MTFFELITIAIALSMDAFAVSVACGIASPKLPIKNGIIVSLFFGGFQALMPLIGWGLGEIAYDYIKSYDHWVAFVLLFLIGAKMLYDAIKGEASDGKDECKCFANPMNYPTLFALAVATSIDALAAGVSFSCVSVCIYSSVITIGITTFLFSIIGIKFGRKIGEKAGRKFTFLGGLALILIGVKILFVG